MPKVNWAKVPGEKGVCVRDYGSARVYMLQQMVGGKKYQDLLGEMPIEEVRVIRETLSRNRKFGDGPLTYEELVAEKREKTVAENLEERKKRQEIIRAEAKRRASTIGRFWEDIFWPHRLSMDRSAKETQSMTGRWLNHVKPFFGDVPMAEADAAMFEDFAARMRNAGKWSPATIHKCLIDLRQMWAYALESGFAEKAFPGKRAVKEVMSKIDNEKKCWLDPDEARLLLETVYKRRLESRVDHDVYCFVVLGLGLGLRAGDICKLTAQAVERHIIDRTKNKRARFVHFNFAPVKAMLDERLSLYPPGDPREPLFTTQGRNSKNVPRTEVPRKFFDIIKELGFNEISRRKDHPLEKIDFHSLRHTFATLAAMRGVDHLTLMRLMGHKTPGMTLRYIEIADAHQAKYQELAMQGIFPEIAEGAKMAVEELN